MPYASYEYSSGNAVDVAKAVAAFLEHALCFMPYALCDVQLPYALSLMPATS
jgi:hypothetical protein